MSRRALTCAFLIALAVTALRAAGCGREDTPARIILSTTTSTYDSGLLDHILPVFTSRTGIEVHVVAQGTGQALAAGQRGDADVLLVHDRDSELRLVAGGGFIDRHDVMYNDFILVGPAGDPAGARGSTGIIEAMRELAGGSHPFISRGDDSGTHRREESLWDAAAIEHRGSGYMSVGRGMGDVLRMASEIGAYAITDRGTYLALSGGLDLHIVLEGDPLLLNQYGVMAVNPGVHRHVNYEGALALIEFLVSPEGQDLIAGFTINDEPLFFSGLGAGID